LKRKILYQEKRNKKSEEIIRENEIVKEETEIL
jgi:hypothetical protein